MDQPEDNNTKPTEPTPTRPAQSQSTPPAGGGFNFGTVIAQAQQVITDPSGFYRAMPRTGGYSEPLIFALVMGAWHGAPG